MATLAIPAAVTSPPGLESCYRHTDLAWRLAQIPDTACVRGAYMNMLDDRAVEFGPATVEAYRDFFQTYRFSALHLYPVKDYLIRLVKLAELQFGAADIYRGVHEIQAGAFPAWRRTLVGRLAFAVLGSDFNKVFPMMGGAIDKSLNFAKVAISSDRPGHYVARWHNQYVYIEHAMVGALEGIARACNVRLQIAVTLDDPFNGVIDVTVVPSPDVAP